MLKEKGKGGIKVSKEDILRNLYSVWGSKPLDHMFNNETVQFYADLSVEGISSEDYMEYARKQEVSNK